MTRMKNVIVSGANGFVGSTVVRKLLSRGVNVTALVHSEQKRDFVNSAKLTVIPFSMDEFGMLPSVLGKKNYDTFYHFAWNGGHAESRNNTTLQLQNVQWTIDSVRTAKGLGCSRFIGVGTIMEHETHAAAEGQENKPGMGYIYGGAKLAAHSMAKSVAADIDIDFVWGMLINAYGIGENAPRLINRTIRSIIQGEDLNFSSAEQNYDFIYIDDAALAFYLLGEKGKPFKNYMIGSGAAGPLKNFLRVIQDTIAPDKAFNLGAVPFTGIDLPTSVFSIEELQRDTGFEPKISFADGVRITYEWLRSNYG